VVQYKVDNFIECSLIFIEGSALLHQWDDRIQYPSTNQKPGKRTNPIVVVQNVSLEEWGALEGWSPLEGWGPLEVWDPREHFVLL
jgi:hypothetical protein